MNPIEIFGWLVIAGAIATILSFLLIFVDEDFVILFMLSGMMTTVGFFVYVIVWIIAKAVGVI
jgi:hypothetical protein